METGQLIHMMLGWMAVWIILRMGLVGAMTMQTRLQVMKIKITGMIVGQMGYVMNKNMDLMLHKILTPTMMTMTIIIIHLVRKIMENLTKVR